MTARLSSILAVSTLTMAVACSSGPRPAALVALDGSMRDAQQVERAKAADPALYADAQRYYAAATKAFEDGDSEKVDYFTELASMTMMTANERARTLDADAAVASAKERTAAAVTARAEQEAALADSTERVTRMERIAKLQHQQQLSTADRAQLNSELSRAKARTNDLKPLAEVRALFDEANALPSITARQDQRGIVVTLPEMFATAKAEVLPGRESVLRAIADLARKYPAYPLSVDGYTDSRGSDTNNLMLSTARATVVAQYLTDQEKLDANRVRSAGHGSQDPVALNTTADGRAKNRRVEVVFVVQ